MPNRSLAPAGHLWPNNRVWRLLQIPQEIHASAPAKWRLTPCAREFIRSLDEYVAIFDPLTWETRLLSEIGSRVVLEIAETAATVGELIVRANIDCSDLADGGGALHSELESLLASLADAGLLERD